MDAAKYRLACPVLARPLFPELPLPGCGALWGRVFESVLFHNTVLLNSNPVFSTALAGTSQNQAGDLQVPKGRRRPMGFSGQGEQN
jgi:hypothetical protein